MIRERLKVYLDPTDVLFGLFPAVAVYAAFVTWAALIVRGIRGEEAKEDWRLLASTAAAMSAFTLISGTRIRETRAVRSAAVEMRNLAREAAEDARLRDQRGTEQQERFTRLTKWLVLLAFLTLAAAAVTLVLSIGGT